MSGMRVLLCIVLPPLAVLDQGLGSIVIVTILTLCGWIPGIIGRSSSARASASEGSG